MELVSKKILITGAQGFLGKHLVKNLLEKRKVPKENLLLPKFEELDLRKWENCKAVVREQDIVLHLAAATGGIEFHRLNPGSIFFDNLMMGIQLLEAARLAGVEKFVGIGSATEYPESLAAPFKEKELWRGYPEEIHAPYSFAKKMLLVQAQAYRKQYNFKAIHLLLTNIYGPGMAFENSKAYVIAALIKKIEQAKKMSQKFIEVWGTGRPERDFLYVEDAVESILLATEKYDKLEPVNIGSGQEVSIRNLVNMLCRLMDFQGQIHWDSSKPDGQLRRLMDISRAKREFGFSPKITFEQGLKQTIQWYQEKS